MLLLNAGELWRITTGVAVAQSDDIEQSSGVSRSVEPIGLQVQQSGRRPVAAWVLSDATGSGTPLWMPWRSDRRSAVPAATSKPIRSIPIAAQPAQGPCRVVDLPEPDSPTIPNVRGRIRD